MVIIPSTMKANLRFVLISHPGCLLRQPSRQWWTWEWTWNWSLSSETGKETCWEANIEKGRSKRWKITKSINAGACLPLDFLRWKRNFPVVEAATDRASVKWAKSILMDSIMFPPKFLLLANIILAPCREFLVSLKRHNHKNLTFPEEGLRLPYQIREKKNSIAQLFCNLYSPTTRQISWKHQPSFGSWFLSGSSSDSTEQTLLTIQCLLFHPLISLWSTPWFCSAIWRLCTLFIYLFLRLCTLEKAGFPPSPREDNLN